MIKFFFKKMADQWSQKEWFSEMCASVCTYYAIFSFDSFPLFKTFLKWKSRKTESSTDSKPTLRLRINLLSIWYRPICFILKGVLFSFLGHLRFPERSEKRTNSDKPDGRSDVSTNELFFLNRKSRFSN